MCENTELSKAIQCCKFQFAFRRHACLYGEQEILGSSFISKGQCRAHAHSWALQDLNHYDECTLITKNINLPINADPDMIFSNI